MLWQTNEADPRICQFGKFLRKTPGQYGEASVLYHSTLFKFSQYLGIDDACHSGKF